MHEQVHGVRFHGPGYTSQSFHAVSLNDFGVDCLWMLRHTSDEEKANLEWNSASSRYANKSQTRDEQQGLILTTTTAARGITNGSELIVYNNWMQHYKKLTGHEDTAEMQEGDS